METTDRTAAFGHSFNPMAEDNASVIRLGSIDLPAIGQSDTVAPRTEKTSLQSARKLYNRVTAGIVLSDALSVALALLIVDVFLSDAHSVVNRVGTGLIFAAVPAMWVAIFVAFGLYAPRHLSAIEEFRRVVGASSFGIVAVVMAGFMSSTTLPRSVVGILWALVLVFEMLTRRIWRLEVARRRATGALALRTLVIGTNDEARNISEQLASRGSGHVPVGFVSAGSTSVLPPELSVVGGIAGLAEAIHSGKVECIFIASSALRSEEMLRVMQVARQSGVDVQISANLPEILASRVAIHSVGSAMALSVRALQLLKVQNFIKRSFDLIVATLVMILTAPLWLAIAAGIKLTSEGPVFFRQTRVTKGGRRFNMIKFRTMSDDLKSSDLEIDLTTPFFKMENDPRITRIGRLLRKTSLDELPQLLNVIAGDMTLVGPRPLPHEQVAASPELLNGRLEVLAGMTGWWQIQGRSEVAAEEAVRLDIFYIENWSVSLDLYILMKTLGAVISRAGAL